MIEADSAIFPNNIVKYVANAMRTLDADIKVFERPLRDTDPRQSIGIHAQLWTPDDESLEMQGIGRPGVQMPTLQNYTFGV